jgi:hypothetical protein
MPLCKAPRETVSGWAYDVTHHTCPHSSTLKAPCAAPASSRAEQPAEDLGPFSPAEAPDTSLQETAPQALAMEIR